MSENVETSGGGGATRRAGRLVSRRPRALLPLLGIVVVIIVVISVFVEVWTDKLWFDSEGYGSVFSKILWTRVALFLVLGLLFSGIIMGNVMLAHRMRPIMLSDGYRNPTLERYQDAVDPFRRWIVGGLGVILFLFAGASASGHWKTYMLWRNAVPFGQQDVYFHKDIGFYVFDYPWYRYLLSFGFTVLILALIATAVTHYLYGAIRLPAKHDRVSPSAQVHLSLLLGSFVALKAVAYWLDRYGLAMNQGHLITGITYTDAHAVLPSKNILMVISIICALLFFANVLRPGWLMPLLGFGLLVLSAILIGGIWPLIVQRFQVKPSEPIKEGPYIQRNIEATKDAFDINGVLQVQYKGSTTKTPKQLETAADDMPGVRVIDPRLVSQAFVQLQQMRGFYTMPHILDVDRYQVGDNPIPQDVIVSTRELNLHGLPANQRNWNNEHTVYTHGYGMVAAYADKHGAEGVPSWAEQDLPSRGVLGSFRQQIYFGESEPNYSIVGAPKGTPPVELNIPPIGGRTKEQNSTYHGVGGVGIGSTFRQLLYSAKFWDSSILLSQRVNADSRLIYDRDPITMVKKIAPWLSIDGDPYPAVVNHRLVWILDGYTTSSDYPMSDLIDLNQATSDSLTPRNAVQGQTSDKINYIRNSVKITVDAYSGQVRIYQWDVADPILRTWMSAFPGVVLPKSDISPALLAHLRYPEDLFKVQRQVLSTYHVGSASTFYSGSENWKVPEDPTDKTNAQPPYYMTVQMPGQQPTFALSTVYVPQNRSNLASFMSVDADAASPDYGKITILTLPSNVTVDGPGQMENQLANAQNVTRKLLPYSRTADTKILKGNLLTIPLAGEMLYAQPVYTYHGGTASYPILQYVTVALGDKIGIGTSFETAIADALGVSSTGPSGGGPPPGGNTGSGGGHSTGPPPGVQQQISTLLTRAQAAFEQAQLDLQSGDLGGYQTENAAGLKLLNQAIALRKSSGGTSTASPTTPAKSSTKPSQSAGSSDRSPPTR